MLLYRKEIVLFKIGWRKNAKAYGSSGWSLAEICNPPGRTITFTRQRASGCLELHVVGLLIPCWVAAGWDCIGYFGCACESVWVPGEVVV
jgi:hypothetical protein